MIGYYGSLNPMSTRTAVSLRRQNHDSRFEVLGLDAFRAMERLRFRSVARQPDSAMKCEHCNRLDGIRRGRPVTAGCEHEHLKTLVLCSGHEKSLRIRSEAGGIYCLACRDAGTDLVPVKMFP